MDETLQNICKLFNTKPEVCAQIIGDSEIHHLRGKVTLYPYKRGSLLVAEIDGIPFQGFYGFHIHEGGSCIPEEGYTGFYSVGPPFNPEGHPHPYEAGDLPVLMANFSEAFMIVYTDHFTPSEVLNRTIVINAWPDDYRSQPEGDSGGHLGCGVFQPC